MNVINSHSSCTMILLSILASTTIISLTSSAPLPSFERRDLSAVRPKVFLLVDQRIPELEKEILDSGNDPGAATKRTKRIGSLSIVNSMDILRQRVLLELARRQALQDQRQIDANRAYLESVGKRSVSEYEPETGERITSNVRANFASHHKSDRNAMSELSKAQDWYEENDPIFHEPREDQMDRVRANDLRLL